MLKLALKIVSLFFIFVFPVGYIFQTYKGEPVETITQSIGLVPMFLVIAVCGVAVAFIFSLIKSKLYNDKTGTIAIAFYGFVMLSVTIVAWVILTTVLSNAQKEFDVFVANFTLYRHTALVIMSSVGVGLFVLAFSVYLALKSK